VQLLKVPTHSPHTTVYTCIGTNRIGTTPASITVIVEGIQYYICYFSTLHILHFRNLPSTSSSSSEWKYFKIAQTLKNMFSLAVMMAIVCKKVLSQNGIWEDGVLPHHSVCSRLVLFSGATFIIDINRILNSTFQYHISTSA